MSSSVEQSPAATTDSEETFTEREPFFCYICGGPATRRGLLKHSTFPKIDDQDEDDDFHREHDLFKDYCSCDAWGHPSREMHSEGCDFLKGYDSQLVSRADTKWLGYLRMLAPHVDGAHMFSPDDLEDLNILSPLGGINVLRDSFSYSRVDDPLLLFGLERVKGHLTHDSCLDTLKKVYRETVSPTRTFNLHELLLFFKLHRAERDDEFFDWGYGQTFGIEVRFEHLGNWNPVGGSEVCHNYLIEFLKAERLITEKWTVMDPKALCDFGSAIETASRAVEPNLSFRLPSAKSNESLQNDRFSSIPPELRLAVLEMLPTASVLNLFLASSAFRELSSTLPQSFWKSRLFFDVPWCADLVLTQTTSLRSRQCRFDKLLYQLKEASKSRAWAVVKEAGRNESISNKDSLRLKNRRHVWLNCERILKDIEARHTIARQQASSIWTSLGNLTTRKVISVSRPSDETPEVTSDAYIVPDLDRETQLLGIIPISRTTAT